MGAVVLVRVRSHRARARMHRILGREPTGSFSFYFRGEFREVTDAEYDQIRHVTGITRARLTDTQRAQLLDYWKGV